MNVCAQKLKMRCANKSKAAAVCAKPKAMNKLTAIYLTNQCHSQEFRGLSYLISKDNKGGSSKA
jgi:hypothetical protein